MNNFKTKYKASKVTIEGITFDSKLEFNIYKTLNNWLSSFPEFSLERQVTYELQPKFRINGKMIRSITYTADFVIYVKKDYPSVNRYGVLEPLYVIDAKGLETEVFKVKKKLFAYKYGQEIVILKSIKQTKQWLDDAIGLPL